MKTLIRNATIFVPANGTNSATCEEGDILIDGNTISAMGSGLRVDGEHQVIEGNDRLVIPGLVNAHFHSFDLPFKGGYDNMPLEIWMLYCYPVAGLPAMTPEFVYLRTLSLGMECLKAGVTTIVDDILEVPSQSLEVLAAVFRAYNELGIRANVSGHMINRPLLDTMPFTAEEVSADLKRRLADAPPPTTEHYLEFIDEAISRFHRLDGRLRYVIAPSGPQRCTEDLLVAAHERAERHDTSYHTHVLETKMQAVGAQAELGTTLVQYMDRIGILSPRTTMAHSIWVDENDIACMARSGASVAHNPVCNLRLGSGIMPFRKIRDAGINVALGSDAISANDTPRLFEVMKTAALLHNVSTPHFDKWPTADEMLTAATAGGARSANLSEVTGSLSPGKRADLVMLDLDSLTYTPRDRIENHLVYSENGSSICKVMVDGRIVYDEGRITTVDEDAVKKEFRKAMQDVWSRREAYESFAREVEPAFTRIHHRCAQTDLGFNRLANDSSDW